MAEPTPLFQTLAIEDEAPARSAPPTQQENAVAIKMVQIALSALWQRFVVAVAEMFVLLSGASVFVLWLLVPDPKTSQIVALGIYCLFVIAMNLLVYWGRRR